MSRTDGRTARILAVAAILLACFAALLLLNAMTGGVRLSPAQVVSALLGRETGSTAYDILWKVRLPRLCAAVLLGGALALSGFLLQTFFNNPIAGPFVLGISSGAKLTVALAMAATLRAGSTMTSAGMIAAAFAGAALSMGFVLLLARKVQRASALILSGVMIGYICSAVTDFVVNFAGDEGIINLHYWSQGSFSGTSAGDVRVMALVVCATTAGVFLLSKPIGAYQLGEGYAQSVGVNIKTFRLLLVLLSSVLCACVTAFAGPVAFVGVAVPHLIKAMAKTAKPVAVIPLCFLGGAVFCLGCDLVARTMFAPVELSLSSVSSLFGAPVVLFVMAGRARG